MGCAEETYESQSRQPPHFVAQGRHPRSAQPGLASRQNPVLWAFLAVLMGPVNRVNAFRSEYLARQEPLHSETVSG